jgi:N6-adenosine-specific RNA methylase IME4
MDLPAGEYDVIYADPPWSYEQDTPRGGVAHHYPTMDLSDIRAMDVPAAEDAVLYLWATVTHAPEALEVLRDWGFSYKTQGVWDKQSYGAGHWFRGGHELLYLGVRGDVSPPDPAVRRSSVFRAEAGEHSAKPDKVRAYIERAHPEADRLELFARDNIAGWTNWGNDVPETEQQTADQYDFL